MNVLHIVEANKNRFWGLGSSVFAIVSALNKFHGGNIHILTTEMHDGNDMVEYAHEKWLYFHRDDGITPLKLSKSTYHHIEPSKYDCYHIHGLWLHANHKTCRIARQQHKPYLVTPHGMLYPETLRRSYWKKWILLNVWFKKDILSASCLHATCVKEMRLLREFGYGGPIAVIGNPVADNKYIPEICRLRESYVSEGHMNKNHRIGFLGRLHPRKNVEAIMRGMAIAHHRNDIELVVMGAGEPAYEEFLRGEAKRLGVEKQVEFAGFVNGEDKFRRLAELSALFVPSDMENFGMIVPEALLVGTPVMASLGTPWKDLEDYKCGWWRDNSPESIAKVIDEVAETSPDELLRMGMRGRELVLDKYESSKVAAKMLKLYSWLLGQGPKPEFVYLS